MANVWSGPGYEYYERQAAPVSYVPDPSEPGAVSLTLYYDQPPAVRPTAVVAWGVGVVALLFLLNRSF